MFEQELQFFIEHQDELVQKHRGQVLVLQGPKVIGVFPNAMTAYIEAQKEHELGTFMIQPCEPGQDAYTVTVATQGLIR